MRAVIFDIDGTLSDPSHRLHHVTNGKRNWDAFFQAMGADACHQEIADLAHQLKISNSIILCTGRPEDYRTETEMWLERKAIGFYDRLYMRPSGDTRADHIVKAQLLAGMREDGYEPWLVVDDRPSVVAMWREAGLTCLQCRDWDERPETKPGILWVMVGPSGAGKTTWLHGEDARDMGIKPQFIVSSDEIREDLCGNFQSQDRNDEVFAALHAVVKTRIRHGLETVVDATNLRRKDRMAVAALAPADGLVHYVVIDRPMVDKRRNAGWRAEIVGKDGAPFDLIAKHGQMFRSNLKDILAGDGLPNVVVVDMREE